MTIESAAWVPPHQLENISGFGYTNDLLRRVFDIYFDYNNDSPIEPASRIEGAREVVYVKRIRPAPMGLVHGLGSALEGLRDRVENTLMAELEALLGRNLTKKEAKAVEVPHLNSHGALLAWSNAKRRSTLHPLHQGGALFDRVERLQPYHRVQDPERHPLRMLAELTNELKHQRPLKVAVLLAQIHAGSDTERLHIPNRSNAPLQPNNVLCNAPTDREIELAIFPNIAVRLPHVGTWTNLIGLLGGLERWTREVAVPVLITGGHEGLEPIRAGIDILNSYDNLKDSLRAAHSITALDELDQRLMIGTMRQDLPGLLASLPAGFGSGSIDAFIRTLDDDAVRDIIARLEQTRNSIPGLLQFVDELEKDIRRCASRQGSNQ